MADGCVNKRRGEVQNGGIAKEWKNADVSDSARLCEAFIRFTEDNNRFAMACHASRSQPSV